MTLEKVVQSIRDEGKTAAEAALAAARKEAAAIIADAEKQAASLKARRASESQVATESLRKRELAAAELEAKKVRLNAEKVVLAKVREAVVASLEALPPAKRVAHIEALVKGSAIKNGRALVAEKDKAAAEKAGIKIAGTIAGRGGVVVESADGEASEDLRYETLVDEVWSGALNGVAGTLFGK